MQTDIKRCRIFPFSLILLLTIGLLAGCSATDSEALLERTPQPQATAQEVAFEPQFEEGMRLSASYITDAQLAQFETIQQFVIDQNGQNMLLLPSETLNQLTISYAEYDAQTDTYIEQEALYGIRAISPESPLLLKFAMPDLPGLLISYCEESGDWRSYVLAENAEDGTLILLDQNGDAAPVAPQAEATQYTYYEAVPCSYEDDTMSVSFPQIANYYSNDLQGRINDLIATDTLNVLNDVAGVEELHLEMAYELTFTGSDIMSIKYTGIASSPGSASPVNVLCTTNINLTDGTKFSLGNAVNINGDLLEKLKLGTFIPYSGNTELDGASAIFAVLNELDNDALLGQLSQDDAPFFFSDEALVLSVEVSHAAGDHIEFAIPYGELGNSLRLTPQ